MQFLDDLWANVVKNMRQTYAEGFIELWFNDLKLEVLNDNNAVLVNSSDLKCKILNDKHLPTIKQYLEEANKARYEAEKVKIELEKLKVDIQYLKSQRGKND